jgi:Flp pilus assembly CpaE family ATPase
VGLGDPERERSLLSALTEGGELVVVKRCLSADELVSYLPSGDVDLVLVADNLHRLSGDALAALTHTRLPLVVLATRPEDPRWAIGSWIVLPHDAPAHAIQAALLAAGKNERPAPVLPGAGTSNRAVADDVGPVAADVTTIAIASGHGSPGRTFVAVNLAASLGAVAPTILIDADLHGPSVAAYLDLDPTRNLFMLAHSDPQTPREWERALSQEIQPFGPRSPYGVALAGIPKPEMRSGITARFSESLLVELHQRFRYVVVDLGADLLGPDVVLHRLALGASDHVLFVAAADLIGLWHARVGLGVLDRSLNLPAERIALVINRHNPRYHHRRAEIEWALDRSAAALVPDDSPRVQQALLAQRPLVYDRHSPAGRQLLDLAGRVQGGSIVLPPEPRAKSKSGLLDRIPLPRLYVPIARRRRTTTGEMHERDVATTL